MLHLKDLDCTKIVQNRPISACGNGISHLRYVRPSGARSCWRKDLGESCGERRDGRIREKTPLRQSRNVPDRIGTDQSTRDARSGRASLAYARRGCGSRRLASSSYKSVARPALTVNNYYYIDIIRMEREGAENTKVRSLKLEVGRGGERRALIDERGMAAEKRKILQRGGAT